MLKRDCFGTEFGLFLLSVRKLMRSFNTLRQKYFS